MQQQIKNLINSQVDTVIDRAETKLIEEGRKKLNELKKQIPTPPEIKKKMEASITNSSCSSKGHDKFMKKFDKLDNNLLNLFKLTNSGIDTLEKVVEKLQPLIADVNECGPPGQPSPQPSGALGKIKKLLCTIDPYLNILRIITSLAPLLLSAFTGPTSNASAEFKISEKKMDAIWTTAAYTQLALTIPAMINYYIDKALDVYNNIVKAKSKLEFVKSEIVKTRAYLAGLLLQYEARCNTLLAEQSDSDEFDGYVDGDNVIINTETDFEADLQAALALYAQQYQDVYSQLLASGNDKAFRRVVTLDENFQSDYNISWELINLN